MKADLNVIEWLIKRSGISRYSISKATGIGQATLSDLATGKTSLDKMTLGNAIKLTEYASKYNDMERSKHMDSKYFASLTNIQGATFDTAGFDNIEEAKEWAKERGQTFYFGEWHDYTVRIYETGNLDPVEEYKER